MCGIVGTFNFGKKDSADDPAGKAILKKMADAISYRGPDDEGYYSDNIAGLGHKRLSIIDLSEKGHQPMCNENNDVWIVFNGEIYNFSDVREDLEAKGHKFASSSDTETIIHAYEEYGERCLELLNGMFAFAIYDARLPKKKLFLARDRIGKKPLFYFSDKEKIVFASELKALLRYPDIKKEISKEAISYYLTFGYVPAPLSIFKSIKKLMPGNFLAADSEGKIKIRQYWDVKYKKENRPEEYYTATILEELENATKRRLISDVPLGAFLSGGIDSSSVVAMMAKNSEKPVKTFSIGFEEESYNELEFAKRVAEKFRTEHREMVIKPDMAKMLPMIVWYYNEPYADSSALPSYFVAKMTRKYVTVALNGDGGDEAFGGYGKYAVDNFASNYARLPSVAKGIFRAADYAGKTALLRDIASVRRLGDFYGMTKLSPKERYMELTFHFSQALKRQISFGFKKDEIEAPIRFFEGYYNKKGLDPLQRKMYTDIKTFLPYDLLVKMDIATMANSLEGRSPYLDFGLVEFAATIPSDMKVKGTVKKYILKKALKGMLPRMILNKKKQGFSVPIEKWFRKDLKNITYDILLDKNSFVSDYLRTEAVKKLLDEHSSGLKNHKSRIWNLLCLELWHRIYIGNGGKEPKRGFDGLL